MLMKQNVTRDIRIDSLIVRSDLESLNCVILFSLLQKYSMFHGESINLKKTHPFLSFTPSQISDHRREFQSSIASRPQPHKFCLTPTDERSNEGTSKNLREACLL